MGPVLMRQPPIIRGVGMESIDIEQQGRHIDCMSTMITEVYDALTSAGAPEDKARAAAQAVAQYDRDIAEIKASLMLLKCMVGFNLAFTLSVVWKIFT